VQLLAEEKKRAIEATGNSGNSHFQLSRDHQLRCRYRALWAAALVDSQQIALFDSALRTCSG
jgi:hypothetical protein